LSNALLLGSARRLETEFGAPVICMLQGEDSFLDGLPEPYRNACWKALAQRAAEIKLFIAPSRYFGELMLNRLGLPLDRLRVVFNGINLDGYEAPRQPATSLAPEASSRQQGRALSPKVPASASPSDAVLPQVAGSCGPSDEPLVQELRERLSRAGLAGRADFHPNLTRSQKVAFLKSLTLFSVPANYGEAFGLYVIEAMAAGVPVVQPRTAAFPELLAATGGGLLCEPAEPESLAVTMEGLLLDLPLARKLGAQGRAAVFEKFSAAAMARGMIEAWSSVLGASEKTAPVGGRR
jgi:glycosyltransferase involved in cell wall biosynthesis